MNENNPLPQWLKCDVQSKSIILFGIPSQKDVGNLMVRITNSWGLIIKDFIIEIEELEECKKRRKGENIEQLQEIAR